MEMIPKWLYPGSGLWNLGTCGAVAFRACENRRMSAFSSICPPIILALIAALCLGCPNPTKDTPTGGPGTDEPGSGEAIAAPSFSPDSGILVALTEITMVTGTVGAEIRYTVDGSEPGAQSPLYDSEKKPRLSMDSTWKAIAVKAGQSSTVTSATYRITPLYPDFDPALAPGLRWNFHYKYAHSVAYSYSGDTSFTTESDFSFALTELKTIDGIEFYRVATTGSPASKVRWNWLGYADHRLYGSIDGIAKTILFDSMLGFWVGQCFFASAAEDGLLSASVSDDAFVVSEGSQWSDNSTIYVPGYGTVYDPDPYSGYTRTTEKYKSGVGPYSWRYSEGSVTSYEASTDTYTILLTTRESGIDIAPLLFEAEAADEKLALVELAGASGKIKLDVSSTSSDYVCYIETLSGGDPVLGFYSWKKSLAPVVEGIDASHGSFETVYLDSPGGDCTLLVSGLPAEGAQLRVAMLKVSLGSTSGAYTATVPLGSARNLEPGAAATASLAAGETALFTTSADFAKGIYLFAIPLSAELDLSIALMKPKVPGATAYSFVSSDFVRRENDHAVGLPETLYYTKTTTITAAAEVIENGGLAGSYIFGWGLRP